MNSGVPNKEAVDRLIIGLFITLFGTVWLLHQADLIQETAWIWPFAFTFFGTAILIGAIQRLNRRASMRNLGSSIKR